MGFRSPQNEVSASLLKLFVNLNTGLNPFGKTASKLLINDSITEFLRCEES